MSLSDHTQPAPHDSTTTEPTTTPEATRPETTSPGANDRAADPLADLPLPPPVDFSRRDDNVWRRLVRPLRRLRGRT